MLDYIHSAETEQFSFLRVPKILLQNDTFKGISAEAKLLYSILFDRTELSNRNGWRDDQDRVYIIFTIAEITESMNCGNKKAIQLLDELEHKAGLIERKRQGLGKPNLIYVKSFYRTVDKYGERHLSEVTADNIKLAMVPVSKRSEAVYSTVNMLLKSIFYSAEYSNLIEDNPTKKLNAKGGTPKKEKEPLTDAQVKTLLDTIRGLPPYVFVMIGLYSGLRREEILALQWDCVFLDVPTPYISVRRAWHEESNRPVINSELKTKSARRDVPIPKVLADCLREEKAKTISEYVIADSEGNPLSYSQFARIWNYIKVRSTGERTLYKYVNGQAIKKKVTLELGQQCRNKPSIVYTIDFPVTPHLLRHTYITNLIHAGVDPKTVQHLAGHKNSKVTMDIYAKVKYNKPEQLSAVVNEALEK